jgi:hypothetical protein
LLQHPSPSHHSLFQFPLLRSHVRFLIMKIISDIILICSKMT